MAQLIDPTEAMFTAFEPKTQNRFIMYIDGLSIFLIKYAGIPSISIMNLFAIFGSNGVKNISFGSIKSATFFLL